MKFNKIKLIAALCLALGASALGQNNVGTLVTDPIRPFSVNSTNPSAIANEIKGGPFSSSNLAGLSNIPAPRLELGAIGYAADTGLYYRLTATNPATWSSINGANITNIPLSGVVGALGYDTNGNIIYDGTNALDFTNVNISLTRGGSTNNLSLQVGTNLTGFYVSSPSSSGEPWVFVHNGAVASAVLTNANQFWRPLSFNNTTNAEISRTNLGLGWSALTNTTASGFGAALYGSNTNPVLANTNGEVVSPTNFWQAAPIATTIQESTPVINATNAATNARLLFLFSIAPSTVGITNTITLPTNGSTFNGDVATITHTGPTSSVTAIRQLGASTNIITLNQVDESVRFLYRNNQWALMDNISYIEPIYFSGTNAAANAAASRTNLGLGNVSMGSNSIVVTTNFTATNGQANFTNLQTDYLEFKTLFIGDSTNTNVIVWEVPTQRTNFLHGLGLGPTNSVIFANTTIGVDTYIDDAGIRWGGNDRIQLEEMKLQGGNWEVDGGSFDVAGETNKAITRTNLGLGATNNVTFSNVTASGTLTATSTVTAKTNLVVEGFVNYTAARTNNTPTNIPNFAAHAAWIEVKIGTNSFFLPAYQ